MRTMAEDDGFCLRWSNHKATVIGVFDSLLKAGTLLDVTLASDGKWLRAHRLVLCACSNYFEELLSFQPEKNAILYMKDVPFSHLEALIAYMYRGEVNIAQAELPSFIKTADSLRIRGLSDSSNRLQELASKATETPVASRPKSPNRVIAQSQPPPIVARTSSASPSDSPTPTTRRSKRFRPESPSDALVPTMLKNGLQDTRIPVVHLTPIDAGEPVERRVSPVQPLPLKRSTSQTALPVISSVQSTAIAPTSNKSAPMVIIPAPTAESESTVDPLGDMMVPKVELEDVDLDSTAVDNTLGGGEEEWSDIEGQGTSRDEAEGWGAHEASNSGATSGGEGTSREFRFRNQGELQLLDDSPSENEWKMILTGTGEKRYLCLKCEKHYKRKNHAQRHCKFECNSEPRYICPKCSYKTKRKENLKKHVLSHHINQYPPPYSQVEMQSGTGRDPLAV